MRVQQKTRVALSVIALAAVLECPVGVPSARAQERPAATATPTSATPATSTPATLPSNLAAPTTAQAVPAAIAPLADHVPASALFYAGWTGRRNLPTEFSDSHLAQLLEALDIPGWSRDELPNLIPPEARQQPATQQVLELMRTIADYAWTNTAAVYSLGKGVNDQLNPAAHFCFIIAFPDRQSADDAERDIQGRITAIIGGEAIPNVAMYRRENMLALTVHDTGGASPLDKLKSPLSEDDRFRAAASHALPGEPGAIALYQNLTRTWEMLDEERGGEAEYERNMRISGLRHAHSLFISAGTDGKDWLSTVYLGVEPVKTSALPPASAPASGPSSQEAAGSTEARGTTPSAVTREDELRGLLGFFTSHRAFDERLYAGVPRAALSMNSLSFDLADLYARVKAEGEVAQPGFSDRTEAWVGMFAGALGVNVNDFVTNIGPDFALYSLPGAGGSGGSGGSGFDYVLVTQPKDPAKADQQMLALGKGIQRLILTQRSDLPKVTIDRATVGGLTLTTLDNGVLSPSWAIKNGYLVMTPNRRTLNSALAEMDKGSINDVPEFGQLRQRLKAPAGASFGYADLPKSLSQMYANWIYTANLAGKRIPPPLKILPLPGGLDLEKNTAPAASATWVDDGGLVFRSVSPYPGGELLSATFGLVAGPNSLPVKLPQLRNRLRAAGHSDAASRPARQ